MSQRLDFVVDDMRDEAWDVCALAVDALGRTCMLDSLGRWYRKMTLGERTAQGALARERREAANQLKRDEERERHLAYLLERALACIRSAADEGRCIWEVGQGMGSFSSYWREEFCKFLQTQLVLPAECQLYHGPQGELLVYWCGAYGRAKAQQWEQRVWRPRAERIEASQRYRER